MLDHPKLVRAPVAMAPHLAQTREKHVVSLTAFVEELESKMGPTIANHFESDIDCGVSWWQHFQCLSLHQRL
jgi:hypothetical protein